MAAIHDFLHLRVNSRYIVRICSYDAYLLRSITKVQLKLLMIDLRCKIAESYIQLHRNSTAIVALAPIKSVVLWQSNIRSTRSMFPYLLYIYRDLRGRMHYGRQHLGRL